MPEIDVKLSAITPSTQDADTSTNYLAVQAGSDLLFTGQQVSAGPFLSNVSSKVASRVARANTVRWSEVINVKDMGAVGDGVSDDTAAIQAAFNFNVVVTNGTTAAGNVFLHFDPAVLPSWVALGMQLQDTTGVATQIPQNTVVTGIDRTTGVVTMSTGATSTVGLGDAICFGLTGKVFFPQGKYLIRSPILMGPALGPGHGLTTVHIEGCGAQQTQILASPPFNGFAFDNMSTTHVPTLSNPWSIRNLQLQNAYIPTQIYHIGVIAAAPWTVGSPTIVVTSNATSSTIVRGAIVFSDANNGPFSSGAGAVPAYIGWVTSIDLNTANGVAAPGFNTWHLADVVSGGVTGAQVASNLNGSGANVTATFGPSSSPSYVAGDVLRLTFTNAAIGGWPVTINYTVVGGDTTSIVCGKFPALIAAIPALVSAGITATASGATLTIFQAGNSLTYQTTVVSFTRVSGTGNETVTFSPVSGTPQVIDRLNVVQGFFASNSFTTSTNALSMAVADPGIEAGNYYIYNWQRVLSGNQPFPTCVGVTSKANWVGTTLSLLNGLGASSASIGSGDLLVLAPASGAMRIVGALNSLIEGCVISNGAGFGITTECTGFPSADNSSTGTISQGMTIRNCSIPAPTTSALIGNHGIVLTQASIAMNVDVSGSWVGVRYVGINPTYAYGRFEVCAYGHVLGGLVQSVSINTGCSNPVILQCEGEGDWIAGLLTDTSSCSGGFFYNVSFNSTHGNSCYGVYLGKGVTNGTTFITCQASSAGIGPASQNLGGFWNPSFKGPGRPCGFYIPTLNNNAVEFIGCIGTASPGTLNATPAYETNGQLGGVAWSMPGTTGAVFLNSNNPPNTTTFNSLPNVVTLTGQITDGAAGTGKILQFLSGSFGGKTTVIGSRISGPGPPAVAAGTIITSAAGNSTFTQKLVVNNAQNVPSSQITFASCPDGFEATISDSPIPYAPVFAASGPSASPLSSATSISLTAQVPGYITGDMTIYNSTQRLIIGTVRSPSLGPPYSGTTIQLNGAALTAWASGDVIVFYPLTNVGAPVRQGGGTNTVNLRWNADRSSWLIA